MDDHGQTIAVPMATGKTLIAPESALHRVRIESSTGTLELIDERGNLNNGWYVMREITQPGATANAVSWVITPHVDPTRRYSP